MKKKIIQIDNLANVLERQAYEFVLYILYNTKAYLMATTLFKNTTYIKKWRFYEIRTYQKN